MTTPIIAVDWKMEIDTARKILLQHRIHFLPVLDQDNKYFGIVSTLDLLRNDRPLRTLKEMAKKKPWTISQEETCTRAAMIMLTKKIHHLLVLDQKKLVGVVSSLDLLQTFL